MPEFGCFSKIFKIQLFCCFITQLVKNLHQWSLYEVIEDILPFGLNTKWPLRDIWLLSYEIVLGVFGKKEILGFFYKTPKFVLLYFENFEKTPKLGRAVRTHFRV